MRITSVVSRSVSRKAPPTVMPAKKVPVAAKPSSTAKVTTAQKVIQAIGKEVGRQATEEARLNYEFAEHALSLAKKAVTAAGREIGRQGVAEAQAKYETSKNLVLKGYGPVKPYLDTITDAVSVVGKVPTGATAAKFVLDVAYESAKGNDKGVEKVLIDGGIEAVTGQAEKSKNSAISAIGKVVGKTKAVAGLLLKSPSKPLGILPPGSEQSQ